MEPCGQILFWNSQEQALLKIICWAELNPDRFFHMFTGLFSEERGTIDEKREICMEKKGGGKGIWDTLILISSFCFYWKKIRYSQSRKERFRQCDQFPYPMWDYRAMHTYNVPPWFCELCGATCVNIVCFSCQKIQLLRVLTAFIMVHQCFQ